MVGTMVLTLLGCGTAVSLNCGSDTASVVGTAVAFGLAVVAMAYTIGGISGCHINPAITLGCLISKRISGKDAGMYIVFQVIGAIIGAAILFALTSNWQAARQQVPTAAATTVLWWASLPRSSSLASSCSWCSVPLTRRRVPATSPDSPSVSRSSSSTSWASTTPALL